MTDLEKALQEGRAPCTEIEYRTNYFWVFADAYPVTSGHLLFVPVNETFDGIMACFKAAYQFGYNGVVDQKWDAFNIGQNVGDVIPEQGNYKK